MKTRELIQDLLDMDMDAEIDVVFDGELKDDEGLEICIVKAHKTSFGSYTIIELEVY